MDLGREANLGLEFTNVNFYDGTGLLVKTATICVSPGTSSGLAIGDFFRVNKKKFTPVEIGRQRLVARPDVKASNLGIRSLALPKG